MTTLQGKIAIVTGASRGLGAGMALELASQGASVMLTYTSDSSAKLVDDLISQINQLPANPKARGCKVDLSKVRGPGLVIAELDAWLGPEGRIDILVNNAGVEVAKTLEEIDVADYDKVYNLNARGTILLTQALLPRFSAANNRIINIGSVGGRSGFAGLSLYCSSKAALEGLTRCWAAELGGNGTTVNQVNPGPVQTAMLDNIPKDIVDMQKKQTPVQNRVGTVPEIAKVVAWLASPASSWISGQVLSASGGWAMY
ncbi:dehydrogenase with different specificitie [Lasiosphaeris hirsuta]|uniref:Dehydrogenase with different specificitie n=1 Tax=Lasiosphaeris hirsuta TaxID=260670 RepID=A0AA40A1P7_9PEZI|nr:dehydrogenase with different specificitie [Lasiosphaeris hirsuta]